MSTAPGARVVGADKVKDYEQMAAKEEMSNAPGPRMLGKKDAPVVTPSGHYALDDIVKELAATPAAVDRILKAELARVEGPRKTALQRLRSAEYARAEKTKTEPRPAILDQIDVGLGKKPVPPAPAADSDESDDEEE